MPDAAAPFACGHSRWEPLGRRVPIRADMAAGAMAPAGGFVSTAGDLARFFGLLDPQADSPLLDAASRREMARPLHADRSSLGRSYGLGLISGHIGAWPYIGHSGSFPGTLSCTHALPGTGLSVSVLTNALDGLANVWIGGAVKILQAFATHGAPRGPAADWSGRYWSLWMPHDLVGLGERVVVALPGQVDPFLDASEIAPDAQDPDLGRVVVAGGFGQYGEPVRRVRDDAGAVRAVWLGGLELLDDAGVAARLEGLDAS
jgi:D-alanyl-D-alanine carboxypeptidase